MNRESFLILLSILLSLAAMVIAVIVIGFSMSVAAPAEGLTNKAACSMMMFSDNWTLGYHNTTVQKCLFLQ